LVVRLEECRQKTVGSQEAGACESNLIAVDLDVAIVLMLLPRVAPILYDFDAELVAEVTGVEPAGFKLQDHFSHQQLMRRGAQ
jgi:hypothetical protein